MTLLDRLPPAPGNPDHPRLPGGADRTSDLTSAGLTSAGLSGLRALVAAARDAGPVALAIGGLDHAVTPDTGLMLVLDAAPSASTIDRLHTYLGDGGHAVIAASARALAALPVAATPLVSPDARAMAAPHDRDPIVFDTHRFGQGQDRLDGLRFEADDLVPLTGNGVLPAGDGDPNVLVDESPVVVSLAVGPGRAVVIGSVHAVTDGWIAAADNAVIVHWALTGRIDRAAATTVGSHRPSGARRHAAIATIDNAHDDSLVTLLPADTTPIGSPDFLRAAGRAGRLLSPAVHDALLDLVDRGAPAGGLLIRNLPIGDVPPTPDSPLAPSGKVHISELVLLTIARRLGQPVGYQPEHGGDIVQNLLPTRDDVHRQTSTSSGVELEFHTETAFHPHKPRYLVLLCLRGDPEARTLVCSISQVIERLPLGVRQVLREARFRTAVDESFTGMRADRLGQPMAVLGGSADAPTLTFDADLMIGTDAEATGALETLRTTVRDAHIGVGLAAGDLLVVDNLVSVHGRTPFTARFDGTDRWLQRTFVVPDLAASATDRRGRVITTRFS
jgi:L-asparagine oxygenase